jgi:hypothetical protein
MFINNRNLQNNNQRICISSQQTGPSAPMHGNMSVLPPIQNPENDDKFEIFTNVYIQQVPI